jgi:hypothetical protein
VAGSRASAGLEESLWLCPIEIGDCWTRRVREWDGPETGTPRVRRQPMNRYGNGARLVTALADESGGRSLPILRPGSPRGLARRIGDGSIRLGWATLRRTVSVRPSGGHNSEAQPGTTRRARFAPACERLHEVASHLGMPRLVNLRRCHARWIHVLAESRSDRRPGGQAVPHLIGDDDTPPPHPSRAFPCPQGRRAGLPAHTSAATRSACLGWDSEDQLAAH